MSFTLCTSGQIVMKAGANVNSDAAISGLLLSAFSDQAEGTINSMSREDWVTNYSGLNANSRQILNEIASNLGAIYLIAYDMSGYTSRGEAESMITVLRDAVLRGMSLIRDKKVVDFTT